MPPSGQTCSPLKDSGSSTILYVHSCEMLKHFKCNRDHIAWIYFETIHISAILRPTEEIMAYFKLYHHPVISSSFPAINLQRLDFGHLILHFRHTAHTLLTSSHSSCWDMTVFVLLRNWTIALLTVLYIILTIKKYNIYMYISEPVYEAVYSFA